MDGNQISSSTVYLSENRLAEVYTAGTGIRNVLMEAKELQKDAMLDLTILPSPFTEEIQFNFNASGTESINIILYNASGKLVYNQTFLVSAGNNNVKLDGFSIKESGLMFHDIHSKEKILSGKIIKM